jgi:hypothetical protein
VIPDTRLNAAAPQMAAASRGGKQMDCMQNNVW